MIANQYVVVMDGIKMNFSKWHDTYDEAKAEAERLCRIEGVPFSIVRKVAYCYVEERPLKWVE